MIKHPEQSFHRTLISHVRGRDGRKPFTPKVEEMVLEQLRRKDKNIWDLCFPRNYLNVGRIGFRHLGYHEARK